DRIMARVGLDRRPRTRVVSALNVSEARPSGRARLTSDLQESRGKPFPIRPLLTRGLPTPCLNQEQTYRSEEHTSELQSRGHLVILHSFPTRRSSDLDRIMARVGLDRRPRTRVVSALNVSEARPSGRARLTSDLQESRGKPFPIRPLLTRGLPTPCLNQEQTY